MGISLDMLKGLKGTDFIVHLRTLELWNQEMQSFLKIMISGSDQIRNIASKKNHSESQPSILSVIVWLLFIASFKYKLELNDQSLKFHKLLTTFQ
jgi:hypothetical protein